MVKLLKFAAACFVPYSVVMLRDRLRVQRWRKQQHLGESERRRRLSVATGGWPQGGEPWFDYREAIAYLESRGCDPAQVSEGSMPERSLNYCRDWIRKSLSSRPLFGLHIGNFVGVSLVYFVWAVRQIHDRSLILAIDPNVPHRGVANPLQHVVSLLNHFGLQRNVLVLTGYSLEKSISNDGLEFASYDPVREFPREASCEQQLPGLKSLVRPTFDFCVIDGNHDPEYLSREIECVSSLLGDGGLLILDDVDWRFPHIEDIYHKRGGTDYRTVGTDGRVGILGKPPKTARRT